MSNYDPAGAIQSLSADHAFIKGPKGVSLQFRVLKTKSGPRLKYVGGGRFKPSDWGFTPAILRRLESEVASRQAA